MKLQERIQALSVRFFPQALETRRHLHMHPELSFEEYNTSAYIQQRLQASGIPFTSGYVKTGIVALIEGKNPSKKCLLLRADMDALPIEEQNKTEYCSRNKGVMHACGHDVHSSTILGAAMILKELKEEFEGTIKVIFQPGEEVLPGGASLMIQEGVLNDPKVDKAIALHVFPDLDAGKAGFRPGMYMASTDELYLTINGKGGHAAMRSEYINPLIIASETLLNIEHNFMRTGALTGTNGEHIPTVIAFGKIEGKGATNVIPEKVEIAGTFRTMNEQWRSEVHQRLKQLVAEVSQKYGVSSEIRIDHGYPFLVNDETFTYQCGNAAKQYLGEENVVELPMRMTAEDFAFISQKVPSCFFRLGTGNKSKGITSGVHTPTFDVDESSLQHGMGLVAYMAMKELGA